MRLKSGHGGAMPKFVIEREVPGAGNLTGEELKSISQTSCSVLRKLGYEIQWIQSYVTGDKVYCVYIAPDEETIREHARRGGFPAKRLTCAAALTDWRSVSEPSSARIRSAVTGSSSARDAGRD